MILTQATVFGEQFEAADFEFVRAIGEQLNSTVGSWMDTF